MQRSLSRGSLAKGKAGMLSRNRSRRRLLRGLVLLWLWNEEQRCYHRLGDGRKILIASES